KTWHIKLLLKSHPRLIESSIPYLFFLVLFFSNEQILLLIQAKNERFASGICARLSSNFLRSLVRTLFMWTSEKALPILYRFFVIVNDSDNLQGHISERAPMRRAMTRSTQL